MAKIKICGDSFTLISAIKAETIVKLQKYYPDALILRNGETKKIAFALVYDQNSSECFGAQGVYYNSVNEEGYPYATFPLPTGALTADDKKAVILDKFGVAISKLNELEGYIANQAVSRVEELETDITNNIEIAD